MIKVLGIGGNVMRKIIYMILDSDDNQSDANKIYNYVSVVLIIISILPLFFRELTPTLRVIDQIVLFFFVVEYILRFATADIKYPGKTRFQSYLAYLTSFYGIIDFLSILPVFQYISRSFRIFESFRLFRLFRLFRSLRIMRVFKIFRLTSSLNIIINTIKRQKAQLQFILWVSVIYLLISSIILFNVEVDTFPTFLDALYWSVGALTTSTSGHYHLNTTIGQIIGMLSIIVGVLLIALPTSIFTAGYMDEINDLKEQSKKQKEDFEHKKKKKLGD